MSNESSNSNSDASSVASRSSSNSNYSTSSGSASEHSSNSNESAPAVVPTTVIAVAAGRFFSAAVKADNSVVVWGYGSGGVYDIPAGLQAKQLSAGRRCIVAINMDDELVGWGDGLNSDTQDELESYRTNGYKYTKVMISNKSGVALRTTGYIDTFGSEEIIEPVPAALQGSIRDFAIFPQGINTVVAIKTDNTVVSWAGFSHLLSHVEPAPGEIPIFNLPEAVKAQQVAVGSMAFAVLKTDGTVETWGNNAYLERSLPPILNFPVKFILMNEINYLIDGNNHLQTWGKDFDTHTEDLRVVTHPPSAATQLKSIVCGATHFVGITIDDKVVAWGGNENYECNPPADIVLGQAEAEAEEDAASEAASTNDENADNRLTEEEAYEKIKITTLYKRNAEEPVEVPHNDSVFDITQGASTTLLEYLIEHQGDAVIFLTNESQTGTLKSFIRRTILDETAIFYECVKEFPYHPESGVFGTFEYKDILDTPYVQLKLGGNYLITLEDARRLYRPNQFLMLQDSGHEFRVTASRAAVQQGGPLTSAAHCQGGTSRKVWTIVPYKPVAKPKNNAADESSNDENAAAPPPATTVKLMDGEKRVDIDVSGSKKVEDVIALYAAQTDIDPIRIGLMYMGKLLDDDANVTPGTVLLVKLAEIGNTIMATRDRMLARKAEADADAEE